ncbi:MAG: glutamate racemase [Balneolaceae bacterium]
MASNPTSPIGIFDSGIGGLTVAKAVMDKLPNEDIIYFGDTARVPYGIKSGQVIQRYASQITRFLLQHNVKIILIACNTVSAVARETVENIAGKTPVLDVIEAGTKTAIDTGSNSIGVIGTLATIGSNAYENALKKKNPDIDVISKACPLLVPLAEEGWIDNEVAMKALDIYLSPFRNNGVRTLILGCTHYPLFKSSIRTLFKSHPLEIIDSADAIASSAKTALKTLNLVNPSTSDGRFQCYVSDRPQRFQELAERFLGRKIDHVEIVDPD